MTMAVVYDLGLTISKPMPAQSSFEFHKGGFLCIYQTMLAVKQRQVQYLCRMDEVRFA